MGPSRVSDSRCRIPIRAESVKSPLMKHSANTLSSHNRLRSPPSPASLRKKYSGRNSGRVASESVNYKQPSTRSFQSSEISYLPPRGSNRQQNPSFETDFGPFGTVQKQQHKHFNSVSISNNTNDLDDINSMFRRPDYDSPITRSERIAGSYRLIEAARNTTPVKSSDYSGTNTWDTGMTHENGNDNENPLLRSQLPPPNQPIVGANTSSGGSSSSRRNLSRSEDLDRILAKYGKTSKSSINPEKDPDFTSLVRTDTTLRVTTDRYCKPGMNPGPGIHAYWDGQQIQDQQLKQEEVDLLSKLNNAMRRRPSSIEKLNGGKNNEKTVQLPGPDGPVTAPMHPIDKEVTVYQVTPAAQHHQNKLQQQKNQSPIVLRRSTHVFPFKETQSGHLVIDPTQIAFESRKISVLVSDPNNNSATVEFTTTKCGASGLLFHQGASPSFTNKNERILHEVKKAMSIQETNENSATGRLSNSKLSHGQSKELNQKKYSDSKKATTEFEESILNRVVSGKNADTHVVIGDKIFPCHSLALESFSTFFDRLNRPPETIQRIQLPETEVSPVAFPVLMDWIVQGEEARRDILTKENLVPVYSAARHLGMKDLELQCISYLERKVDSSDPDLLSMWEDVKKRHSSCSELVRIIAGKMAASYHDIYKTRRFLQMEVDELFMLLNSDDISIDSEMDVYESAVSWLIHDWKSRKVHTNKIMSTVRFGLLSPLQLTQINLCPEINKVKNEKDYNQIITYGTVKSMIDDGLSFSILDDSYKNQPEELKKWVDKTGVKAPAPRSCLVNRKRGSPLILEKISLLEDASQTKLRASFSKIPEKSSSYTLLDSAPKPGTPFIEASSLILSGLGNNSSNTLNEGCSYTSSKDQKGKSRIPKPPVAGSGGNDKNGSNNGCNNQSPSIYSNQGSNMAVQELSRPKLLSNSSNTLQQAISDTDKAIPLSLSDSYSPDTYSTTDYYEQYNSTK